MIVPAFNEEASVGAVVRAIVGLGLPVVVIDDGSTDGTGSVARSAGATVLTLPFNLGVGGALRCGFRWATQHDYTAAVQCDADGQHDPAELQRLLATAIERDDHLLIGSRFAGSDGFRSTRLRRLPMRLLARVASNAARTRITDASSGYRVIREPLLSEFARAYPVHYLGDTFEALVQAGRYGYRISEVPVVMRPRDSGVPSAGPTASLKFLVRVLAALLIGSSHRYRAFDGAPRAVGR